MIRFKQIKLLCKITLLGFTACLFACDASGEQERDLQRHETVYYDFLKTSLEPAATDSTTNILPVFTDSLTALVEENPKVAVDLISNVVARLEEDLNAGEKEALESEEKKTRVSDMDSVSQPRMGKRDPEK